VGRSSRSARPGGPQVGHRDRLAPGEGGQAGALVEVLLDLLQQLDDRVGRHRRPRAVVLRDQHQPDPVGGQHGPGGVDGLLQHGRQVPGRRHGVGQPAQRASHRPPVKLVSINPGVP
jgi:hypothetical protein